MKSLQMGIFQSMYCKSDAWVGLANMKLFQLSGIHGPSRRVARRSDNGSGGPATNHNQIEGLHFHISRGAGFSTASASPKMPEAIQPSLEINARSGNPDAAV